MLFAIPDQLIFLLVVVVLSMLHSWWKKRKGETEETGSEASPEPPARRQTTPPPSKAASWEEELRRLLQGEEPARSAPPPIVVQQPRATPPPLPRAPAARPAPAPRAIVIEQSDPDMEKGLPVKMPSLEHSAQAFLRASQLESRVAEHMQRVDKLVTTHQKAVLQKQVAPEIRQAIAMVRQRQSQRAAILAGVILGPPKSMEG